MSFTVSYVTKVLAQQHAQRSYPLASFGLVIDGGYIPIEAVNLDQAVAMIGNAEALVFSKPDGGAFPDAAEMALQQKAGKPFGIIGGKLEELDLPFFWGEDCEVAPLVGRPFVHGIWDCYSLVRDCFALGKDKMSEQGMNWRHPGVTLPDVPRDDAWWTKGQDLYMDWMKPAGFIEITAAMAQPGDGFLMKIRSDKLNHAGVLVSDNEILHHLPTRLSRREVGGVWFTQIDKWVRYQG